ncbi:hypothetical protein [Flavobacterium sp.]|jgi:uncharacterized membrane protein|uniref:hypothetical protein n=1 Tax=Flavobacterium sp. TaxID=239 RepID=UPI0037BEE845
MNKLFYIIYNSYYKNGAFKDDIPSLTVGGIFVVFFYSVFKFFLILIEWFNPIYSTMKLGKTFVYISIGLYGILVYFLFYHKRRYRFIYERYKNDKFLNSKLAKRIGFFFVILMILSPIMIVAVKTKITYGWWIKIK